MAVSADGFIAGPNDETPWSDEEWQSFKVFVQSCDAVLLGLRTYEIIHQQHEFIAGPAYIVVTHEKMLLCPPIGEDDQAVGITLLGVAPPALAGNEVEMRQLVAGDKYRRGVVGIFK